MIRRRSLNCRRRKTAGRSCAVTEAGARYEPETPFWKTLLALLPPSHPPRPGVLPHHSRYVSTPGLTGPCTRGKTVWLRPSKPKAFGYAG